MKTLKLFNSVLSRKTRDSLYVDYENGLIIEANATWCKDEIVNFYTSERLNGNDLNKTFHKSWEKIKTSTRFELLIDQIFHYLSTYGSGFQDEVYIPDEILQVPETKQLCFKVVKAITRPELIDKCLDLLRSGIALKEETLDDIFEILRDQQYQFTGYEKIKNKEAIVRIADIYGVYPQNAEEFLRFVIYKATGETLLIKSNSLINEIVDSGFNPSSHFTQYGLVKLAEIFNRYKPLFIAFKGQCPRTINKISKLSKKYHKPMVQNPLNQVTSRFLTDNDIHWLDNATIFSLFKAISCCYMRANGQEHFVYRIRNGKSWAVESKTHNQSVCIENYQFLINYLLKNNSVGNKSIYLPEDIKYALPTSEKMFVGNIPTGTKLFGDTITAGVYWENSWGARDIDISGQNILGRIGWDSHHNMFDGGLMYSGDITNAPHGAVEYLRTEGKVPATLLMSNIYNGRSDCNYKIIIGKGSNISRDFMMDPNNLMAEAKCQSVQKQTILGMFLSEPDDQVSFSLLNFGSGHCRVGKSSDVAMKALHSQCKDPLTLDMICDRLGFKRAEKREEADIDLSVDKLDKSTFINLFLKR